jgi:hypothetical protein
MVSPWALSMGQEGLIVMIFLGLGLCQMWSPCVGGPFERVKESSPGSLPLEIMTSLGVLLEDMDSPWSPRVLVATSDLDMLWDELSQLGPFWLKQTRLPVSCLGIILPPENPKISRMAKNFGNLIAPIEKAHQC